MTPINPDRLAVFSEILNEHTGNSCTSQRQRFKAALLKLGSVLTFELSRFLDIYYPPARKFELLHDENMDIILTWAWVETESGERHRVGNYVLKGVE